MKLFLASTDQTHAAIVACPRWALENNCKQCKTLDLVRPDAVTGDEQRVVLTFLLPPLWEALGTY